MNRKHMRGKRGVPVLLAVLLAVSTVFGNMAGYVHAAETGVGRYYYSQLTDEAKEFYDAMYEMYSQGIFKTGTGDYDLTENGHVTQEQLAGYSKGDMALLLSMGAARDAFYADYPDIFYVDFSYLSLRVTRDSDGVYHAYLGPGRSDDYFVAGFSSKEQVEAAIAAFDSKVDEIVEAARSLTPEDGEDPAEQQVRYVHDYIIRHTSYRLEDACRPENVGHVRTAYGALVQGESVCEGYARAVKSVLDRLGIPCVLVQGIYRHTADVMELHMWNEVQVDGKWYGVDATIDDPVSPLAGDGGLDGYECSEYLLVGETDMARHHIASGIMSEANFEFTYPELSLSGLGFDRAYNTNGLVVEYNQDGIQGDLEAGIYKISYRGMGYSKAAENGKYFIARMYLEEPDPADKNYCRWAYLDPKVYPAVQDNGTEIVLYVSHIPYVEFAVTDVAPGNSDPATGGSLDNLYYQGDPFLLEAETGLLYNPSGNYVAPPYIKSITPDVTGRINMNETYHVSVTYDDRLVKSGEEEPGYKINSTGPTALENCQIENFAWDGESTVTFDFSPSRMWADDSAFYYISITGLVGERSGKAPNTINYFAEHCGGVCAYRSQGYMWNVFGQPMLMENTDLSTNDWKTSDGQPVSDVLKYRMALVTTETTEPERDQMLNEIGKTLPGGSDAIEKAATYNISLTLCKSMVIETGQGVRVSIGFPAGYGPESEGVTFKAYHFSEDEEGNVTGVEELDCLVTQYGLLITCKSFSPFAVVAVTDPDAGKSTERTVILSGSMGGEITGAESSIFTLAEGESKELTVRAQEGYELDGIVVAGKQLEVTDPAVMTVPVSYEDLEAGSNIVSVDFVTKQTHEKEQARGEEAVTPIVTASKAETPEEPVPPVTEPEETTAPVTPEEPTSSAEPEKPTSPAKPEETKPQPTSPSAAETKPQPTNPSAAETKPQSTNPPAAETKPQSGTSSDAEPGQGSGDSSGTSSTAKPSGSEQLANIPKPSSGVTVGRSDRTEESTKETAEETVEETREMSTEAESESQPATENQAEETKAPAETMSSVPEEDQGGISGVVLGIVLLMAACVVLIGLLLYRRYMDEKRHKDRQRRRQDKDMN